MKFYCAPEQTSNIPGLKYNQAGRVATGPIDALAVLHRRASIPPPLPEDYPLLERGTMSLRDYQTDGVSWLVHHLGVHGGALLADDMGLGKTAQALVAWNALGSPKLFVVCPGSVRESWSRQFKRWTNTVPFILTASKDWPKALDQTAVVTSYELAKKMPTEFFCDMVVLDEIHNLKGRGAERSLALSRFARATPMRLGLSGTPMWSRPRDLWRVLNILFGYRFGTAEDFDFAYCAARIGAWGQRENSGVSLADELRLRMDYIMKRRLKREVAKELPPVIREVRWVPGTKKAKEALRQALVGSGGSKYHDALEATLDDKLDVAVEAARDFGTNVLMFTWMKSHAEQLQVLMDKAGMKSYLIHGDISHKTRDAIIQQAAKDKSSIVCTIDSVKEGVDGLQFVTSNAVFHALDHLPIKVAQTISRLDRIGQTEPVTAIFIAMRDSADELVVKVVLDKLEQWLQLFGVDDNSKLAGAFSGASEESMNQEVLKAMYEEMR